MNKEEKTLLDDVSLTTKAAYIGTGVLVGLAAYPIVRETLERTRPNWIGFVEGFATKAEEFVERASEFLAMAREGLVQAEHEWQSLKTQREAAQSSATQSGKSEPFFAADEQRSNSTPPSDDDLYEDADIFAGLKDEVDEPASDVEGEGLFARGAALADDSVPSRTAKRSTDRAKSSGFFFAEEDLSPSDRTKATRAESVVASATAKAKSRSTKASKGKSSQKKAGKSPAKRRSTGPSEAPSSRSRKPRASR